jgi:hypothetical protein
MVEFHALFQHVTMAVCLGALAVFGVALVIMLVKRHGADVLARIEWLRRNPMAVFAAPLVVALILYGGSKTRVMFQFGKDLEDNGSWATNDTVCIKWLYVNHDGAETVNIAYQEEGASGGYNLLAQALASDYIWEGNIVNATNYNYKVYFSEKTPDAKKETFVAQIDLTPDGEKMIPVHVDISVDGGGVFDFIPRPSWPTNTTDEASAQSDDAVIDAYENEGKEIAE